MILPIFLSSLLEGAQSYGYLQGHYGKACDRLSLQKEVLQPLGSNGKKERACESITVFRCSPFLLHAAARELIPKPKSEQVMPLLICLYGGQHVYLDGWMDKY